MKELYFSHIPKTAGQSIINIIEKESSKKGETIYLGEKYFFKIIRIKYKKYYEHFLKDNYLKSFVKFPNNNYKFNKSDSHWNITFWHIPLSFWKEKVLIDFKRKNNIFLCVRNPYDRIVSDFKFWIKFYKAQINGKLRKKYNYLLIQIQDIYENNFDLTKENLNKFVKKLLSSKKYKYSLDGHLIPQHKYIYTIINKKLFKIPDVILRFENLENDFIKLKKKYLPYIPNNTIKKTHINPTQNKDLDVKSLNDFSKKIIYKYYKLDFKILKYSK